MPNDRLDAVLDGVELARERRVEERARRLDRHPPTLAERPSRPAGVHEPHADRRVRVELLAEHPCVDGRRLREERRAEARREGRLRLRDADLGSGELGGEAGEEPVHRLVAAQSCDRRQDPERVGSEEHDRARMTSRASRGARSRSARACTPHACSRSSSRRRDRGRRRSSMTTFSSTVPNDRVVRVDLRLGLGREPNDLRVAATLEVEDAVLGPAVLVVADQPPLGIRRERRLAGPREPEEHRDPTVVVRRSPSSASGRRPRAAAGRS